MREAEIFFKERPQLNEADADNLSINGKHIATRNFLKTEFYGRAQELLLRSRLVRAMPELVKWALRLPLC